METLRETVLFVGSVSGLYLFPGFPEGKESRGDLVILSVIIVAVVVLGIVVFDC